MFPIYFLIVISRIKNKINSFFFKFGVLPLLKINRMSVHNHFLVYKGFPELIINISFTKGNLGTHFIEVEDVVGTDVH